MKTLLLGLYLSISLILVCAEYTGDSLAIMAAYYATVLANLGNAVRLINKHK